MALKTQPPAPPRIDGLPPQMLRHLPPGALPRRPHRYLLYSSALVLTFALAFTTGWIVVGLPLTLVTTFVRSAIIVLVGVKFMTGLERRWRRMHPPMDVVQAVELMMARYVRANVESAPWN